MYLACQLKFYGIFSIVTIRNILDCIVSFDDMMISWRTGKGLDGWLNDAQFALPMNYLELDEQSRYEILARSFGVWLVAFYLSWKRCSDRKFVNPITLRYEVDILNPENLVEKLTSRIKMSGAQTERLSKYIERPDEKMARLNVGIRGRGKKIDSKIVDFLFDYTSAFKDELSDEEMAYLIG